MSSFFILSFWCVFQAPASANRRLHLYPCSCRRAVRDLCHLNWSVCCHRKRSSNVTLLAQLLSKIFSEYRTGRLRLIQALGAVINPWKHHLFQLSATQQMCWFGATAARYPEQKPSLRSMILSSPSSSPSPTPPLSGGEGQTLGWRRSSISATI